MENTNTAAMEHLLNAAWDRNEQLRQEFDQIQSQHPEVWDNNFVNQAFDLLREKLSNLTVEFTPECLKKTEEVTGILSNLILLAKNHVDYGVAA